MNLRPYQQRALEAVESNWRAGITAQCVCGPTGAGKSVVMRAVVAPYRNPVVVAHTRALTAQLAERVHPNAWTVHSLLSAAEAQRLPFRHEAVDLLCIDECHHYSNTDNWHRVHELFPAARRVGFTATPERADGGPLAADYQALVPLAKYSELLADGFLVPCDVMTDAPQLTGGVKRVPVDRRVSVRDAYLEHCPGMRCVAFCEQVKYARAAAAELAEAGVPCDVVTGDTPDTERDRMFRALASGDLKVLLNAAVMTEGIDIPEIEAVILSRSCDHNGSYLQIAGRALRPAPGKTRALMVDLVGAATEFGPPHADIVYSLDGEAIVGGGGVTALCCDCMRAYTKPGQDVEDPDAAAPLVAISEEHIELRRLCCKRIAGAAKADPMVLEAEAKRVYAAQRKAFGEFKARLGEEWRVWSPLVDDAGERLKDESGNDLPTGCPHCARERSERGNAREASRLQLLEDARVAIATGKPPPMLPADAPREDRIRALIALRARKRYFHQRSWMNLLATSARSANSAGWVDGPGDWETAYPGDDPPTHGELWEAATEAQREAQERACDTYIAERGAKAGLKWHHFERFRDAHEKATRARRSA